MDAVDALSFLSNVLSIVTFLFTISIALLGFYTLTSNALREIETLQEEWDGAGKEIYLLLRYWDAEKKRGNEMLENYLRTLQSSLDSLAETALFILRESRSLKSPSTADEPARLGVFDLKRRVIWIYKRQIILGKMAEFSRRRQALIHMQLSLLLTKSIYHEIEAKSQTDILRSSAIGLWNTSEATKLTTPNSRQGGVDHPISKMTTN